MIRTDQSFTAAAWLRWSDKEGDYTVLEQKGTHQAPFRLGNTADHGLVFTLTSADTTNATVEGVLSGVEPPVGEWFHLAGVYDATARTASLYLNGTLVKSAPVSFATWNADTAMSLGSRVNGDLDEVQIYQRPLSAADVTVVVTSIMAPAPVVAPALQNEAAKALAAAVPGSFDYQRISLQTCQVSPGETGHAEYDARIRELSYNSCWSSYLYIQDYEEDDSDGKMKKSFCKGLFGKKGSVLARICSRANPFDDNHAFRFRATTVIHSYLGNSTGAGVVGGAGTGIKPSDMKVFIQFDDFAVVDGDGRVVIPASQLSDIPIAARVRAGAEGLEDGDCESGPDRKKDITDWIPSPYQTFDVRATIDPSSVFICRVKPYVVFYEELLGMETEYLELPLWSQEVIGQDGKPIGVFRKGSGQPQGWKRFIPNFRCDNLPFGASDPNREDRRGGCINTRAKRVFVMSYRRNPEFAEVIKHIDDVFTPGFAPPWPPYRPGWIWDTPSLVPPKKPLGNEQDKKITVGNWAAKGDPLTKLQPNTQDVNRMRFSKINMLMDMGEPDEKRWLIPANNPRHAIYINYCKYYMPEKYNEPWRADKLPIGGPNSCDEYPFASAKEGAGTAQGRYSLRALNKTHNTRQGSRMRVWQDEYRVGTGNSFWVLIEP
ncbi:LamG-like jellyroll fold domain-containing protein [Nonomuraea sp. KM90]|uniref:LamG-like jellyroll fold domain-containing protein n=1 Tax=Nonomuraea sp. KM90 TaxID=3457428 RepID=UPI003FCDFCD2